MKSLPYLIVTILIISLSVNIFLLCHPVYPKKHLDCFNIITGVCLWISVIVLFTNKRH
ncbi:hypothetical protein Mucpa_2564 [Mucilaginibacter paludis DSM 18603]|uniref:Uncharacterized protein n=1 Tax=Mucilaginibacter paludis DSM 18603 TaxID=714943 RepID=H1Y222_9SPHI|nr:hypothetical protein Mucpa_2564 [Mucilaginibacter paludis DSM 18603]